MEKKSFCKNIRSYFREYCSCTSIHGFRYFGEKRTVFERVWWVTVFIICLAACVTSIYGVYKKWEGSPVIVNFANQGTPIWKIPFPAVTICPETKSVQTIFNYTKILQNKKNNLTVQYTDSAIFEYMSLVCDYNDKLNHSKPNFFSDEFFDKLHEVTPTEHFMIFGCGYLGETVSCGKLFSRIITDEGVCYTFNMLNRSEIYQDSVFQYKSYQKSWYDTNGWSVENGYAPNATIFSYPRRALYAGATNGLSLKILTPEINLDYTCKKTALQGYKVLLHSPMRIPRPSQEYFRVPLEQSVVAAVQPVMISTSQRVQMYNPQRRGCYFPSEKHLKYFKIYSSLNCRLECLTDHTLKRCGCVNYYMPRKNGTKLCGTGKISCMKEAERYMQAEDLFLQIQGPKSKRSNKCDCLPICTDITYHAETSQTDWDWKKSYIARGNPWQKGAHFSSLTIFFKSDNFIISERNELYGPIDFLANFGGLLGLFTGFSVLSLMEMLYFLSIRMICNVRLYGFWAGPQL